MHVVLRYKQGPCTYIHMYGGDTRFEDFALKFGVQCSDLTPTILGFQNSIGLGVHVSSFHDKPQHMGALPWSNYEDFCVGGNKWVHGDI